PRQMAKSNYGPKGSGQYTAADNVRRKQANASDIPTGIQGIKVKSGANASEMSKGAMRRLAPFQPQSPPQPVREELELWQDEQPRDARENLAEHGMTREARMRALHRLHSSTAVRKNPITGEREFLLHRGMGADEHAQSVKDNGVIHHSTATSWSPHYAI